GTVRRDPGHRRSPGVQRIRAARAARAGAARHPPYRRRAASPARRLGAPAPAGRVKFVLATFNQDKLRELRGLLDLPGLELVSLAAERRAARFRTVCVACWPDGVEFAAYGVLEGRIALAPRGSHGFGYDPVFEVEDGGRTLAELTAEEKNARSHRARAARS